MGETYAIVPLELDDDLVWFMLDHSGSVQKDLAVVSLIKWDWLSQAAILGLEICIHQERRSFLIVLSIVVAVVRVKLFGSHRLQNKFTGAISSLKSFFVFWLRPYAACSTDACRNSSVAMFASLVVGIGFQLHGRLVLLSWSGSVAIVQQMGP